ncbi:MAG: DUF3135 domain-containing protein [Pseudomonadales bacterium]
MKIRLPAFDVMLDLARNDPDQLEVLRKQLTDAVIGQAQCEAHKRRLEGLQFRVDMERRRAATPLAATIRISEMMAQSLADLHRSLVTPIEEQAAERASVAAGRPQPLRTESDSARILPFSPPLES